MEVGIEAINTYCGQAFIDVRTLFEARKLDSERFDNLMMLQKSVSLPCEDAVTNGVNAAKPLIDALSEEEKDRIELVITGTESGIDFGKSISNYVHEAFNLNRRCRQFEVKQACYGGTAALQTAVNFIRSQASPGAKALVISTDSSRAGVKLTYAEPSMGTGGIAMIIGENPEILELDFGANGYHGYQVMDTCRPEPNMETGDPDLSLLSYLDCFKASYQNYLERVEGADFFETFDYLACHTPFGGMVRGAHRNLVRGLVRMPSSEIETDFQNRLGPSLEFCVRVGNIYSATLYLALCSLLENAIIDGPKRIGLFSYGSGCCSEFYSGIVTPHSQEKLKQLHIPQHLDNRYALSMEEYDLLLDLNSEWIFGIQNKEMDFNQFGTIYEKQLEGKDIYTLKEINNYHRQYIWS